MHRLNFLKSLVTILLGSKFVTFFRPEKVSLIEWSEESLYGKRVYYGGHI